MSAMASIMAFRELVPHHLLVGLNPFGRDGIVEDEDDRALGVHVDACCVR